MCYWGRGRGAGAGQARGQVTGEARERARARGRWTDSERRWPRDSRSDRKSEQRSALRPRSENRPRARGGLGGRRSSGKAGLAWPATRAVGSKDSKRSAVATGRTCAPTKATITLVLCAARAGPRGRGGKACAPSGGTGGYTAIAGRSCITGDTGWLGVQSTSG